jgi:hypothetical protein
MEIDRCLKNDTAPQGQTPRAQQLIATLLLDTNLFDASATYLPVQPAV